MTAQQKSRVLIRDRERVAVDPVAGAELAFEVGSPQIVRRVGADRHNARMLVRVASAPAADQTAPREELRGGARRRPVLDLRMPAAEHREQLPRPPVGVQPAKFAEQLGQHGTHDGRAAVRPSTAIGQPTPAILGKPGEPLVADAPAHAVALTELHHRKAVAHRLAHEIQTLLHGITLLPRHRRPRRVEF